MYFLKRGPVEITDKPEMSESTRSFLVGLDLKETAESNLRAAGGSADRGKGAGKGLLVVDRP